MGTRNWARSASAGVERFRQGVSGLRPNRANRVRPLKALIRITFDEQELNLLHYTRTTLELGPFLPNRDAKAMNDRFRLL